ncbi:MAG: DUF1800 family protein [Gammaproteobacteria bacterium]
MTKDCRTPAKCLYPGLLFLSLLLIAGCGGGSSSSSGTSSSGTAPTVSAVTATVLSSGSNPTFSMDVTGKGFVASNGSTPGSQITVNGTAVTGTQYVSATEVTGVASVSASGTSTSVAVAVQNQGATSNSMNVTLDLSPAVTATAAARFLDQATFGPTPSDIALVQGEGFLKYLSDQFAAPKSAWTEPVSTSDTGTPNCPLNSDIACLQRTWLNNAVSGQDQVRQRVALALESIWVISNTKTGGPDNREKGYALYLQTVNADAFANWKTLMYDVTLTPDMGIFLDMLNSGNPTAGQIANENYAREFMQLFNIGLYKLNLDGSQQLDSSGNPIPTYDQDAVEANAQAFTGWTLANGSPGNCTAAVSFNNPGVYDCPMTSVLSSHDTATKTLLDGSVLSAGNSPEDDLDGVITAVFNDPSAAPFICRQLILHLVTSNPSPQYIARVATVFDNDGHGTRGNMQAVVTAILLDPEARANDSLATQDATSNPSFGHLNEPVVFVTRLLRVLGTQPMTNTGTSSDYSYAVLSGSHGTSAMGENLLQSFSVFNFFPPAYTIPDAYLQSGTTGLQGAEFALNNTASTFVRINFVNDLVRGAIANTGINLGGPSPTDPTTCQASPLCTLAQNDINGGNANDTLLDTLNTDMMHSQMPKDMYSTIDTFLKTQILDPAQRVRMAVYLIGSSSQYQIIQ